MKTLLEKQNYNKDDSILREKSPTENELQDGVIYEEKTDGAKNENSENKTEEAQLPQEPVADKP